MSRNAAPLSAARVDEDRPGAMAGELRAESHVGVHEQAVIVDHSLRGPARAAPRVHERRVHRVQVASAEAPILDQGFRSVDQRHVGVAEPREHVVAIVGGDELLVAVPHSAPRDAGIDGRGFGPHDPHHARAEVGEDHAGHAAGQAEAEVARADGDLDDRQALDGRPVDHRVIRPLPAR